MVRLGRGPVRLRARPPDSEIKKTVDENTAVDEVEPPFSGAFKDAGHRGARLRPLFAGRGQNEESILPKAPRRALPVHEEGRRPEVMQGLMARSTGVSAFAQGEHGRGPRSRRLIVRLFFVGVVGILLAFLESFRGATGRELAAYMWEKAA